MHKFSDSIPHKRPSVNWMAAESESIDGFIIFSFRPTDAVFHSSDLFKNLLTVSER